MNANTRFKTIITDIEDFGNIAQPRDLKVKENLMYTIHFDPTLPFADFQSRKFNFKYFAGELAWYLSKDNNIDYIKTFIQIYFIV